MKRLLLAYLVFISCSVKSQDADIYEKYEIYRSPIRLFLNKFSWTLTTGYTHTKYKFGLEDLILLQSDGRSYVNDESTLPSLLNFRRFNGYEAIISDPKPSGVISLSNRYYVPVAPLEHPVNNPNLQTGIIDSSGVAFKGFNSGIPLNLMLHFNASRFRIGLGYMFEFQNFRPWKPKTNEETLVSYETSFNWATYKRFYGMLGYRFRDFWDYAFAAELNLGNINQGRNSTVQS